MDGDWLPMDKCCLEVMALQHSTGWTLEQWKVSHLNYIKFCLFVCVPLSHLLVFLIRIFSIFYGVSSLQLLISIRSDIMAVRYVSLMNSSTSTKKFGQTCGRYSTVSDICIFLPHCGIWRIIVTQICILFNVIW